MIVYATGGDCIRGMAALCLRSSFRRVASNARSPPLYEPDSATPRPGAAASRSASGNCRCPAASGKGRGNDHVGGPQHAAFGTQSSVTTNRLHSARRVNCPFRKQQNLDFRRFDIAEEGCRRISPECITHCGRRLRIADARAIADRPTPASPGRCGSTSAGRDAGNSRRWARPSTGPAVDSRACQM